MKTLLGALALVIAAPVAAQTPAADPHAEHTRHSQQQKPSQPAGKDHGHMMDCKECCEKMKKESGKMDCCDEHREGATKAPAEHAQHSH